MFSTNAPTASKRGDNVDLYAASALSKASSNAYDAERQLLQQAVSTEAATEAATGVVGTFLSLLEEPGDAATDETEVVRAVRVGATGRSVQIVIDTRTPATVAADALDTTALDDRLDAMDAPFLAPENNIVYANSNKDVPSTLWRHAQVVIDEATRCSTAAKIDERFDKNLLAADQQKYKLASGEKLPFSFWRRLRSTRGIVPVAAGTSNFAYEWNNRFAPATPGAGKRIEEARAFFETHIPPLELNASAARVQKRSSQPRRPKPPPPPPRRRHRRRSHRPPQPPPQRESLASAMNSILGTGAPVADARSSSTGATAPRKDMLLRAPKSVSAGSTLEAAIDAVHQYTVASKHDVGVRVSAAIIFDINRLQDKTVWIDERTKFAALLPQSVPQSVKDVANGVETRARPTDDDTRFGVILVVERMEMESNDFLKTEARTFQPRAVVDGLVAAGSAAGAEEVLDDAYLAMAATWKLLATMSSIGFVYFDFHMGNVMFKRRGRGFVAKLVDLEPKFGRLLTYQELHGRDYDRSWKALLVLNALTLAMALAGDASRTRLFTTWVSADKLSEMTKLSGAALDIGHFNRFQKMSTEVSEAIQAIQASSPDDDEAMSLPEQLLSVKWMGGYRGTGLGNAKAGAIDYDIFETATAEDKEVLKRLNALTVDSYDVNNDSTRIRMEAALRETLHHRSVTGPRLHLLTTWSQRQAAISSLLAGKPSGALFPRTDPEMTLMEVNQLISTSTSRASGRALASTDNFLRNEFDFVIGPIMRYAGALNLSSDGDGLAIIDFLSGYVFERRCKRTAAFADQSIVRAPLHPHHADYAAKQGTRVAEIVEFDDPTADTSSPTPAEGSGMDVDEEE